MPEPLKNIYSKSFFEGFLNSITSILPHFKSVLFLEKIYDDEWDDKELKQRMRHISCTLHDFLPSTYNEAVARILELVDFLKKNQTGLSLEYMFLPDYIEQYGLEDLETSIMALEEITQFTSCEFAVRPFIMKYPIEMMNQMFKWSSHQHHGVRRFSSEGCRPRLPWAMALPRLKEDPTPILPVLENLKNDSSEYVRKSVANNLNDIAKDNPQVVINLARKWLGQSKNTDWIIKHGCRTLLKQGNLDLMKLFGFGSIENIKIINFQIQTPKIKIGESLEFNFSLLNNDKEDVKIRLEYAIYYQKANGSLSKKVYKISEKEYPRYSTTVVSRKQSFRIITTRKFHLGLHQLSMIINGVELEKYAFELIE